MKILIGCECSGRVRDAFLAKGHIAISCDLIKTDSPGPHIEFDLLKVLEVGWDMLIAFPPCTRLAVSGARWFKDYKEDQKAAVKFFMAIVNCDITKICIENPVGIMSTVYRKPDQYIQPWQFGHGETKKTGLWLKNLPLLKPTNIVEGREARIHKMLGNKNQSMLRSITYQGIADAMADQWG